MDLQEMRPRFYEGQFLAADDLAAIVAYLRSSAARHALGEHTWGIAMGLQLVEKPAPGTPNRVEVTLQPGFGWDGFARPVANSRPTRLAEELFADIPFNPVLDDVASGGTGRLVKVWLAYDEIASRNPAPGFETCATDDQHARIGETFRFEVGDQPVSRQRSRITIGTQTVDAERALDTFDTSAPPLFDTSVPHQQFPLEGKPPRWLLPIGYVRWIARDNATGYFAKRDLKPADKADGLIRSFRRYIGAVAEYIEAAAGAIVLHRRSDPPNMTGGLASLLASTLDPATLLDDLVWVEGNIRIVGHLKLCTRQPTATVAASGDLLWRDREGGDQGTPFYMARRGDVPGTAGNRDLWVVLGKSAESTNRLVVGAEQPGSPASVVPQLVVVSSGDVGVGRRDPETRLNVVGQKVRVQDIVGAAAKKIDLRTDGSGVGVESPTDALTVRATGPSATTKRVLINPDNSSGRVGVRVSAPAHDIDMKGSSIKLGVEDDGGGQLVVTHDGANNVHLQPRNTAGTSAAPELRITGPLGTKVPLVSSYASVTYINGQLAVGLPAPAHDVDVKATSIKLGLEANGGGQLVITSAANDDRVRLEGRDSTGASTASEVSVCGRNNGTLPRFTVRASATQLTGYLGVGTSAPLEPIHINGNRLRVEGPSFEQAIFGSEGNGAVMVGTINNNVFYADMRRLGVPFDTTDPNAWLTVYCRNFVSVSDENAKTNINTIEDALDRLSRLRGVSYDFKDEVGKGRPPSLGLIAQEVAGVVPEAVPQDGRRTGIAYTTFIPLLIEAVKDLKGQVDDLRRQLARLSPPDDGNDQ